MSGHLNSRRSSIKVTRVATNVLAEQTMSWEADGGGQLWGRMMSGGKANTTSSNPRCALSLRGKDEPFSPFNLSRRTTCRPDLRYDIFWNREENGCVRVHVSVCCIQSVVGVNVRARGFASQP